jgi:sugar phosphate permease
MKKETKLLFYQTSLLIMLYIGYGFYYYTRKSITFMMPHFDRNSTNSINITKEDIGKASFFF